MAPNESSERPGLLTSDQDDAEFPAEERRVLIMLRLENGAT